MKFKSSWGLTIVSLLIGFAIGLYAQPTLFESAAAEQVAYTTATTPKKVKPEKEAPDIKDPGHETDEDAEPVLITYLFFYQVEVTSVSNDPGQASSTSKYQKLELLEIETPSENPVPENFLPDLPDGTTWTGMHYFLKITK